MLLSWSEQAGIRPVIVAGRDTLDRFTTTVIVLPVTSNLRRCSNTRDNYFTDW
ncbi:type II toxin-antitoxin system PemK/MazF family toxin [Microcoleus sp. ARI1-A5]|uniref:type II toxin-antitoxin system PemK/MazF family toxin n=1 Tax=unclassified Microcoleus TaxID=2642155 RepID=UPI003FA60E5E